MKLLVGLALFVFLLGITPETVGLRRQNYKPYLIFTGIIITLVMGLRTYRTGSPDTYQYMFRFSEMTQRSSFLPFFEEKLEEYEFLVSESGYYFYTFLLSRVFNDPQIFLLISSAIITGCICRFIYHNTSDAPLALLIYICLGLFTFNMNGLRQALAMSVCLVSYEFVKKRKLVYFVLTILLAMQFHKTAICFVPVYFLPMLEKGKGNIFLYFVCLIICLFSVDWFVETYNAFSGEEYVSEGSADGGGLSVILIYIASIGLTLFKHKSLNKPHIRVTFYMVTAGFAAYVTRYFSNQILERISYYYFFFTLLLVPNIFEELSEKERQLIRYIFCGAALALFAIRVSKGLFANYKLFFQ